MLCTQGYDVVGICTHEWVCSFGENVTSVDLHTSTGLTTILALVPVASLGNDLRLIDTLLAIPRC